MRWSELVVTHIRQRRIHHYYGMVTVWTYPDRFVSDGITIGGHLVGSQSVTFGGEIAVAFGMA